MLNIGASGNITIQSRQNYPMHSVSRAQDGVALSVVGVFDRIRLFLLFLKPIVMFYLMINSLD